jgi:putative ATP-binding cassette transporter
LHNQRGRTSDMISEGWRLFGPLWKLIALGTAIGILGGLSTAWLLVTINSGLHAGGKIAWSLAGTFALLCFLSGCGTALAGGINTALGQKIVAILRKDIASRIVRTPIAVIESAGPHRLLVTLTSDVETISAFLFSFAGYTVAIAITIGSFAYLFLISKIVFAVSFVAIVIGTVVYILSHRAWVREFEGMRVAHDDLYKQYRAITEGAKELKMSRDRRADVVGLRLWGSIDRIASLKNRAMQRFWVADAAGSTIYFVAIGVLLAFQHELLISAAQLSGAVIILLYAKAPVEQIASALPAFDQARISIGRIAALAAQFHRFEPNLVVDAVIPSQSRTFRSLELRGVQYAFPKNGSLEPFALGPINLTISSGEMVFIVGDNGSGKTTLLKLLLGLYEPKTGEVLLDGTRITPSTRDDYRQIFSAIFSDYFLFESLPGNCFLSRDYLPLLEKMEIAHKVTMNENQISMLDLSAGQRKRLALVYTYLENRPVLVTDEWAADQDPTFRRIFYEELLPDLKRQGKTLIVISHDDRFFGIADRILRMKDGQLIEDRSFATRQPMAQ